MNKLLIYKVETSSDTKYIEWLLARHSNTNLASIMNRAGDDAANTVILHVVANMTNVIDEINMEG